MEKTGRKIIVFLLLVCALPFPAYAQRLLVPGGQVIGMHLEDNTVSVGAIADAGAEQSGLRVGDRIVSIDGTPIHCPADIRGALDRGDTAVRIRILRDGKSKTVTLRPTVTRDGPRLGIYTRVGTTGIGTVTYYDPVSRCFGALGHGVNTPEGTLLDMTDGRIYAATVLSVKKGKSGQPGQLMGCVRDPAVLGTLDKNTARGVFGKMPVLNDEPLPVAENGEIKKGKATIRCCICGSEVRSYDVEILKLYPESRAAGRNMLVRVTDPALLDATGGIVQGMSGSPVLQNGKLIGAITHVLINDPTTGYAIFAENMLETAQTLANKGEIKDAS